MAITRKTIAITDQQEDWIKAQIASGNFTSHSEYIRSLIRKDQESQNGFAELQKWITEGIKSGHSERNLEQIRKAAKKKLLANG